MTPTRSSIALVRRHLALGDETAGDLSVSTHLTIDTIRRVLAHLRAAGQVERGEGPNGCYVWWLT